jgi:hypothetical protein
MSQALLAEHIKRLLPEERNKRFRQALLLTAGFSSKNSTAGIRSLERNFEIPDQIINIGTLTFNSNTEAVMDQWAWKKDFVIVQSGEQNLTVDAPDSNNPRVDYFHGSIEDVTGTLTGIINYTPGIIDAQGNSQFPNIPPGHIILAKVIRNTDGSNTQEEIPISQKWEEAPFDDRIYGRKNNQWKLIEDFIPLSQKAQAQGVATLDLNGRIPIEQLPESVLNQLTYKGLWDADTNTPALTSTPSTSGDFYIVSEPGTFLGVNFEVGDWIISNGDIWERVPTSGNVVNSFQDRTGAVEAVESDYQSFYPRLSQSYQNPAWIESLSWDKLFNVPDFATRWPVWGEIDNKPSTFAPSSHNLNFHSDVSTSSNTTGQLLRWNGSAWVNWTPNFLSSLPNHTHVASEIVSGVLSTARLGTGTANNSRFLRGDGTWNPVDWSNLTGIPSTFAPSSHTMNSHSDVSIASVATGQLLRWNGSNWANWIPNFLTSFNETDPTVPAHVKAITAGNISNWNTAFGWGNHASVGYAVSGTGGSAVRTNSQLDSRFVLQTGNRGVVGGSGDANSLAGIFGTMRAGSSSSNRPESFVTILNIPEASNSDFQFAATYSSANRLWFRSRHDTSGNWQDWEQIYHSGNLRSDNQNDARYSQLGHTHPWSQITSIPDFNKKYLHLQSTFRKAPSSADWAQNNSYQLIFSRVIRNGNVEAGSMININISAINTTGINNKLGILRITFKRSNNTQQQRFLEIYSSGSGFMSGRFNIMMLRRPIFEDNSPQFDVHGNTAISMGTQSTSLGSWYSEENPFTSPGDPNNGFTLEIHYSSGVTGSSNYGGNTAVLGEINYGAVNESIFPIIV